MAAGSYDNTLQPSPFPRPSIILHTLTSPAASGISCPLLQLKPLVLQPGAPLACGEEPSTGNTTGTPRANSEVWLRTCGLRQSASPIQFSIILVPIPSIHFPAIPLLSINFSYYTLSLQSIVAASYFLLFTKPVTCRFSFRSRTCRWLRCFNNRSNNNQLLLR